MRYAVTTVAQLKRKFRKRCRVCIHEKGSRWLPFVDGPHTPSGRSSHNCDHLPQLTTSRRDPPAPCQGFHQGHPEENCRGLGSLLHRLRHPAFTRSRFPRHTISVKTQLTLSASKQRRVERIFSIKYSYFDFVILFDF